MAFPVIKLVIADNPTRTASAMSDLPTGSAGAFDSLLNTLRTLPLWLFAGLALIGYAMLFLPTFGGADATAFRRDWALWVWIWAVSFTILAATRAIDLAIVAYQAHRKRFQATPALRLVPRARQCWWHLAKQRDDSFVTQLSIDVAVANLTDRPVRLIKVRLVRPKPAAPLASSSVMLPRRGSPYHSEDHSVPPHDTAIASVHLMARGALAKQSKMLRVTIGITDQFGQEYLLKRLLIPSHDRPLPKVSLLGKIKKAAASLRTIGKPSEAELENARPLPAEWQHGEKFEAADLILSEERRSYAANNRERGGLGSLNVTLQSEPNHGWTEVGKVPNLLWKQGDGKTLGSDNLNRLLHLHATLKDEQKTALEEYLKSHLHRRSPNADIGYFIFLALHRMGRTEDALSTARSLLAGDKDHGYSNLLGVLSALVSHEHGSLDATLCAHIADILKDDAEHNFRLLEKLTLARVLRMDAGKLGS